MADVVVNPEKITNAANVFASVADELKLIRSTLDSVRLDNQFDSQSAAAVNSVISKMSGNLLDEAARMDSFESAAKTIANEYLKAEMSIIEGSASIISMKQKKSSSRDHGADKRGWFRRLWDWLTNHEKDDYDVTTKEQEKAADAYMKRRLWEELQDEKYSEEYWDKASIEERKQILQDYMREVIKAYNLQDVNPDIVWDSTATYTANSVTWGYYTHAYHRVTLNEQVLTDRFGSWDSYELLGTVSHELRHAYQHEAVDHPTDYMVSKETIDEWSRNFKNYITSDVDYTGYRSQSIEVDARDFEVSRKGTY